MTLKPKTRISYDSTGRAIREVMNAQGVFELDVDDDTPYSFNGDMLNLEDADKVSKPDFNPYHGSQVGKPIKQRNRLDYMRELSEAIKKKRASDTEKK